MEGQLDISVIIVSYNTRDFTLKCLESLYRETTKIRFETILVDNASADNSASAIMEEFPQVRVLALKENIGFARANNLASNVARGEYLLLLNPDTLIINNAVEKIHSFAQQNQEAGIWGGRTILPDGSLNPTCCYGKTTPWSLFCRATGFAAAFPNSTLFNRECFGRWQYDSARKVDIVTGCFMLVKSSAWKQLGGFDPRFFMYGEEVDFCLRAKEMRYHPMFTPEAEIVHYGGASESDQANRWAKVFRAKATLICTHWPARQIGFGLNMLLVWAASRAAIMTILAAVAPETFGVEKKEWTEVWRRRKEWQYG